MEAVAYAEAVGTFLRFYRREHGITLESVAQLGREFGATWSLSSVQSIEAGRAAPTLPTLLTLALVLGRLSGEPLRLADLLGTAEVLERPYVDRPDQPVLRAWVDRALSGGSVELTDADYEHAYDRPADAWDARQENTFAQRCSGPLTADERHAHVDVQWEGMIEPPEAAEYRSPRRPRVSLAESRAAKKLGIRPLEVQQRAVQLWGRSLEAEALTRAGADSTPQARGRVTRVLVEEILESMKEGR
jgi:transcriptional regulator with XRE-family HTH domain